MSIDESMPDLLASVEAFLLGRPVDQSAVIAAAKWLPLARGWRLSNARWVRIPPGPRNDKGTPAGVPYYGWWVLTRPEQSVGRVASQQPSVCALFPKIVKNLGICGTSAPERRRRLERATNCGGGDGNSNGGCRHWTRSKVTVGIKGPFRRPVRCRFR